MERRTTDRRLVRFARWLLTLNDKYACPGRQMCELGR